MNFKSENRRPDLGKAGSSPISWIYRGSSSRTGGSVTTAMREQMIRETLADESDEDEIERSPEGARDNHSHRQEPFQHSVMTHKASSVDSASEVTAHSALPVRQQGEARIVAPNVSKLSPHSAVEVRLQSANECVAVLCSVDVLKMRSGFFHDVLCEQESSRDAHSRTANDTPEVNPNVLWRDAIVVPEVSPFEAAAYLESLHEGRALFRGEWNFCWARLSVTWVIEDLMLEYSAQIEQQMNKIVSVVEQNHWRTSPSVLAGMRVAVFRKGANPMPTIVTGVAIECLTNIGYSKLRIAFDTEKQKVPMSPRIPPPPLESATPSAHQQAAHSGFAGGAYTPPRSAREHAFYQNTTPGPGSSQSRARTSTLTNSTVPSGLYTGASFAGSLPSVKQSGMPPHHDHTSRSPPHVVGDVAEPFWVQSVEENSVWCDPDELFLINAKRKITITDKRMFWEMARALIELPELSLASHDSKIRTAGDLTRVLLRPEYRILWIAEAAQFLPKEVATELIRSAYVVPDANNVNSNNSVEH